MTWSAHLGVQRRPLGALVRVLLSMDLRNETYGQATQTRPDGLVPPLYWVIGQFLATSALLSLALFMRTDVWFFSFANLSASFALLFSCLVVEFHEVALDPRDVDVIGHRPLTSATYALARSLNLGFYVGLMTISTTIFPTIIGAALPDAPALFVPAYLAASVVVALVTTSTVLLLYTTLGAGGLLDQARGLLAWVQILGIMALFYGGQLMLRNADGSVELFAARPPDWVRALPTAWLAELVARAGRASWSDVAPTLAAVTATCAGLVALAGLRIAGVWRRVSIGSLRAQGDVALEVGVGTTSSSAGTTNRAERAAYWLVRTMVRRDQELALRCWPAFGLALAAVVLGVATDQLADPYAAEGPVTVLSLSVYVLLAGAIPGLYQNLRFSRDFEASWLIRTAPLGDRSAWARGVRSALRRTFWAPALAVLATAIALTWRAPLDDVLFVLMCALVVEGAARVSEVMILSGPPFDRSMARGSAASGVPVATAVTTGSAAFVAGLQYAIGPHLAPQVALHAAVLLGVALLGVWARRAVSRTLHLGALRE